jgi:hypothetical protein
MQTIRCSPAVLLCDQRGATKEEVRLQLSLVFDILQPEAVPVVALI